MVVKENLLKSAVDIYTFMINLFQDKDGESSMHEDTRLVCRDGTIFSSRLLLSLAFPSLGRSLALLVESIEPVIILPDYAAEDVKKIIQTFLSDNAPDFGSNLYNDCQIEKESLDSDKDYHNINWTEEYQANINDEVELKSEEPDEAVIPEVTWSTRPEKAYNGLDVFKCYYCIETFETEIEKEEHERNYRNADGRLKCRFENCDSTVFKFRKGLVKHLRTVHYTDTKASYTCYFCGDTFIGRNVFKKHMKLYKDGPKDFKCPEEGCDSRFRVKRTLLDHLRKHRGIYEYSCEKCGKICTTRYTLKSHMNMHSTTEIICHICSKKFKHKALLRNHITLTHANEEQKRRFKCDQCEKAYATSYRLNNHMVTHSGVRNFTCPTCGNKFMSKATLVHHEKSHSGIKPFKCNICGKGFITGNKRNRHEIIHSGQMDFSCSKCGKNFNQKINKNTHEKKCKETHGTFLELDVVFPPNIS